MAAAATTEGRGGEEEPAGSARRVLGADQAESHGEGRPRLSDLFQFPDDQEVGSVVMLAPVP
jgi:hypothetical protein